jgi:hypothetical protein
MTTARSADNCRRIFLDTSFAFCSNQARTVEISGGPEGSLVLWRCCSGVNGYANGYGDCEVRFECAGVCCSRFRVLSRSSARDPDVHQPHGFCSRSRNREPTKQLGTDEIRANEPRGGGLLRRERDQKPVLPFQRGGAPARLFGAKAPLSLPRRLSARPTVIFTL